MVAGTLLMLSMPGQQAVDKAMKIITNDTFPKGYIIK
jgi:hypothetical protein